MARDTPILELTSSEFLTDLKMLYPATSPSDRKGENSVTNRNRNPWYLVAGVTFAACNRPEALQDLLKYVLEETSDDHDDRLFVVRSFREALFKSGLIIGYSRTINGLVSLREATPIELCDKETLRDVKGEDPVQTFMDRGDALFVSMYNDNANHVQDLLDDIHPDMGWFSKNIGYGYVYGANHVLSQVETSYAIVAGLIAMDTPRQSAWHLQNCINGGATVAEARAVRTIAMEVAARCGIVWENEVPDVICAKEEQNGGGSGGSGGSKE